MKKLIQFSVFPLSAMRGMAAIVVKYLQEQTTMTRHTLRSAIPIAVFRRAVEAKE